MRKRTKLEILFEEVVLADDSNESIDALPAGSFAINGAAARQRADYLLQNRGLIVEVKSILGHRAARLNDWLNTKADTGEWLHRYWFGPVHMEKIFAAHPNGRVLKQQALEYFYRNVLSNTVRPAMPQLRSTKEALGLHTARCGVVLLNDKDDSFEAGELSHTLALHLAETDRQGKRLYGPIDFVLLISATPSEVARRQLFMHLVISPEVDDIHLIEWYVINSFRLRWASHTGCATELRSLV